MVSATYDHEYGGWLSSTYEKLSDCVDETGVKLKPIAPTHFRILKPPTKLQTQILEIYENGDKLK